MKVWAMEDGMCVDAGLLKITTSASNGGARRDVNFNFKDRKALFQILKPRVFDIMRILYLGEDDKGQHAARVYMQRTPDDERATLAEKHAAKKSAAEKEPKTPADTTPKKRKAGGDAPAAKKPKAADKGKAPMHAIGESSGQSGMDRRMLVLSELRDIFAAAGVDPVRASQLRRDIISLPAASMRQLYTELKDCHARNDMSNLNQWIALISDMIGSS